MIDNQVNHTRLRWKSFITFNTVNKIDSAYWGNFLLISRKNPGILLWGSWAIISAYWGFGWVNSLKTNFFSSTHFWLTSLEVLLLKKILPNDLIIVGLLPADLLQFSISQFGSRFVREVLSSLKKNFLSPDPGWHVYAARLRIVWHHTVLEASPGLARPISVLATSHLRKLGVKWIT